MDDDNGNGGNNGNSDDNQIPGVISRFISNLSRTRSEQVLRAFQITWHRRRDAYEALTILAGKGIERLEAGKALNDKEVEQIRALIESVQMYIDAEEGLQNSLMENAEAQESLLRRAMINVWALLYLVAFIGIFWYGINTIGQIADGIINAYTLTQSMKR